MVTHVVEASPHACRKHELVVLQCKLRRCPRGMRVGHSALPPCVKQAPLTHALFHMFLQVPKGHEGEPGLGIKIAAGLMTGAIGISVASPTDLVKVRRARKAQTCCRIIIWHAGCVLHAMPCNPTPCHAMPRHAQPMQCNAMPCSCHSSPESPGMPMPVSPMPRPCHANKIHPLLPCHALAMRMPCHAMPCHVTLHS